MGRKVYLVLSFIICFSDLISGRRHSSRRIYGGYPAAIDRYPWHVGLLNSTYFYVCSGSIVSQYFVLTAAHCVNDIPNGDYIIVKYGTDLLYQNSPVVRVTTPHIHPRSDIAVLELQFPINFSPVARPIRLRSREAQAAESAVVTGWGIREGGRISPVSLAAQVSIMDRGQCKRYWPIHFPAGGMCAVLTGRGFCEGDSGAALVVGQSQVGVVSFLDSSNCAVKNRPDVYLSAAYFRDFINEKTRNSVQWSPI